MKKVYLSKKWKRHSARISRRVLKSKRKTKKEQLVRVRRRDRKKALQRIEYKKHKDKKNNISVDAPSNFSILNNAEGMLTFFAQVRKHVGEYKNVFFNMSNITKMTEDAVLYMLSRFDDFERVDKYIGLSGNVPIDSESRRLLQESGFYKHLTPGVPMEAKNRNVLSIKSDRQVLGRIAKEVVDFTNMHLGKKDAEISKNIYATLIECMANTRNHAFERVEDPRAKWWLIALFRKKAKCVHFTFLDDGFGIPTTIPKSFQEKVRRILSGWEDSKLITSALEGDFRTQTGLKWRGTGLPKIHSYAVKGTISNLKIISRKGYISCIGDSIENRELDQMFSGTLLSWDIS